MQNLQPSIKCGRNVWNAAALPLEEFESRVRHVQEKMAAQGLDLAFVYGRAFNGKGDQCYLTNFVTRLAGASAVALPRAGKPTVFFEGALRGVPSFKRTTWVEDVRAGNDIGALCAKYLQENKAQSVGLVGVHPQMPFKQYRALREALAGRQVMDCDNLVADLRLVKSERELSRMRAAGAAVAAMLSTLGGGSACLTERVGDAEARLAARLKGAEDVRFYFMLPGEWALRLAGDGRFQPGQRVLVYAAAEVDRYWAEAMRTFIATENGLAAETPATGGEVYRSMVKAVAPGKTGDAAVSAALDAAARAGLRLADDFGYGNGIGLSLDEAPGIAAGSIAVLAAGMSLSLRLFSREQGGFLYGDTLLVNNQGSEIVT
jgi:Xaa-Pro aminopeptidase